MDITSKIETEAMDDGKTTPTALYLYEITLGDMHCGGELVARNAEEAQRMAVSFGGVLMGRVTDERVNKVCSICGNDYPLEPKSNGTIKDEWPDEI